MIRASTRREGEGVTDGETDEKDGGSLRERCTLITIAWSRLRPDDSVELKAFPRENSLALLN